MAETLNDTYSSILAKVRVIADRQQLLADEIESRRAENLQLLREIESLKQEIARLNADNEYLRMSNVLANNRQDVEATRSTLAKLVRDIDRCIADLSAC